VPATGDRGIASRPGATLAVLTGLNALNYLDRFLTAPLLPLIILGLGLSDGQAGSLQTVFILVYALVCPAAGWLGDRKRRLSVAAVAIFIWSTATVTSGLASTFGWLLLARAVVGVGEAGYTVVTPSLLADHYPPDRRGRALAIFYAAMPVGIALGYVLGGQIGERHGWRPAFFVAGGPGLVLALALLLLHEPPRGRYDRPSAGRVAMSLGDSLRALRGRPSFFFNMAAQTIYSFTMGGLGAWMPTYFVRERGLGIAQAGTMFGAVLLAAGFLGTIAGGQIGDRLARRFRGAHFSFSAYSLIASIPFSLLAVLAPQPAVYWSAMFVTLFLLFMNYGPLNAALVNVLPADLRARGVGIHTTTIHLLGDALSPFLIGAASDAMGLRWPVLVAGLFLPVAGVVLLAGRSRLVTDLGRVQVGG
jgi:MFS transporter, Spinster family, sphingosine-1-phosphate transporter